MRKRIFIGSFIKIPSFTADYIQIKKDFDKVTSGKWIPEENFHITFRFIGETTLTQIESIKNAFSDYTDKEIPANINFKGIGVFPDLYRPRVLFIKIEDSSGILREIKKDVDNRLAELGYSPENRLFIPHLTLRRIKSYKSKLLKELIHHYRSISFGVQKNVKLDIIESILKPSGAIYKKLD